MTPLLVGSFISVCASVFLYVTRSKAIFDEASSRCVGSKISDGGCVTVHLTCGRQMTRFGDDMRLSTFYVVICLRLFIYILSSNHK